MPQDMTFTYVLQAYVTRCQFYKSLMLTFDVVIIQNVLILQIYNITYILHVHISSLWLYIYPSCLNYILLILNINFMFMITKMHFCLCSPCLDIKIWFFYIYSLCLIQRFDFYTNFISNVSWQNFQRIHILHAHISKKGFPWSFHT